MAKYKIVILTEDIPYRRMDAYLKAELNASVDDFKFNIQRGSKNFIGPAIIECSESDVVAFKLRHKCTIEKL